MEIGMRQGTVVQDSSGLFQKMIMTLQWQTSSHRSRRMRTPTRVIDGGFGTGIISAGRTWGKDWQIVWFAGEVC